MKFTVTISQNEENNGMNKIILSPEEITYVEYNFEQLNKNSLANMESIAEIKISGKLLSNVGIESNGDLSLYEKNKENVKGICEWAFGYKDKTDYRNVSLEVELGDEKTYFYSFKNMFAIKLQQSFSVNYGVSAYVLTLKQKYFEDIKVNIEY